MSETRCQERAMDGMAQCEGENDGHVEHWVTIDYEWSTAP